MGRTKPKWEGNRARIFDDEENESVLAFNPIFFYDDFLGAWTAVPDVDVGGIESGCEWACKIVKTAGSPTVAIVADAAGGLAQAALDATAEAQSAFLYMGDDRRFIITQGAVFEARIKVSVLPTLVAEAVWGLAADYDVPDNITYSAWFTADGSGEIYCESDDTATDRSVTSGVTVLATDWKVYKIDFRDVTDVKFYINGTQVATGTTFPYAGTGVNATLQPFLGLYKASGAGLGTIQVDYVRIWLNRS